MKPQTILLVRHGQSWSNVDVAIHATVPDHKIGLSELGVKQALAAGKAIAEMVREVVPPREQGEGTTLRYPSMAAYVSSFARTRQTFEMIRREIDPMIRSVYEDPRLREQECGSLRDIERAIKIREERKAYSPFYFRSPGAESGADVFDRQKGFLETIHRDFEKNDYPPAALIVGHGFQLRILLMAWLHWKVEEFEAKRNLRNCEVLRLELQADGKYQLVTPLEDET